jgi:hypothetical protein
MSVKNSQLSAITSAIYLDESDSVKDSSEHEAQRNKANSLTCSTAEGHALMIKK